jgi:hypothetical protein
MIHIKNGSIPSSKLMPNDEVMNDIDLVQIPAKREEVKIALTSLSGLETLE